MKNTYLKTSLTAALVVLSLGQASAGVYTSEQAISSQQFQYNKQQVMSMVDTADVQQKLTTLGVSPADAKLRIASMTNQELMAFNQQMNEMPAGGIIGTIVTVLVVVVVLDLMGITDVYPFIRPI
ncbi:PA2779 family protein [Paraglaciecola sp.]|uniref:PA2779 family protein n=1 Tax=Paraglaciecola sp. TaxID=1920173 RepID=UPI0030F492C6